MFTMADIRNIAIQIEANGEKTYRRAAACATDPELRRLLAWMADEERSHGEQFAALAMEQPLNPEQAELEAMGRSLLQDIVRSQTFSLDGDQLAEATAMAEVLDQSIEFERDTIQFYEFLAGFLDDPEAVRQVETIIAQERNHVRQLDALLASRWPALQPHSGK